MDDTKKDDQSSGSKNSIADQMTEIVATAAGALAETAVRSVANRERNTAAKKAPEPVKTRQSRSSPTRRGSGRPVLQVQNRVKPRRRLDCNLG